MKWKYLSNVVIISNEINQKYQYQSMKIEVMITQWNMIIIIAA